MVLRRVRRRRDAARAQPVQVIVESEGEFQPVGAAPARLGQGPSPWPALFAVVAVLVAVAVIVGRGDRAEPDDTSPPSTTTAAPAPDPTKVPPEGGGDLTIAGTFTNDRIEVQATSSRGAAPWVSFEICAAEPVGCAPLWPSDLSQEGSTYSAVLRATPSFRSAGGHLHDCSVAPGCELWVSTADRTTSFALDPATLPGAEEVESEVASAAAPSVRITDQLKIDGGPRTVEVSGQPRQDYTLSVCVVEGTSSCVVVADGAIGSTGLSVRVLRVPRVVSLRSAGDGGGWHDYDCGRVRCELRLAWSGGSSGVPLPFAFAETQPAPTLVVAESPAAIGEVVTLQGSGFLRVDANEAARAAWLLCGAKPSTLAEVPAHCATPRSVAVPVIDGEGAFVLSIPTPDPSSLRTWATREPIECGDTCWAVVLAEPFPEIVAAPIRIRPSIPE